MLLPGHQPRVSDSQLQVLALPSPELQLLDRHQVFDRQSRPLLQGFVQQPAQFPVLDRWLPVFQVLDHQSELLVLPFGHLLVLLLPALALHQRLHDPLRDRLLFLVLLLLLDRPLPPRPSLLLLLLLQFQLTRPLQQPSPRQSLPRRLPLPLPRRLRHLSNRSTLQRSLTSVISPILTATPI